MPDLQQARIGQLAVVCRDVARATRFYRDTLGLRHLFDAGPSLAFFDCGGVRLMLTTTQRAEDDHPGSLVYYFVSDLPAVHAELEARGVTFLDAPHVVARLDGREVWLTAFVDSEGNTLGLMEEREGTTRDT